MTKIILKIALWLSLFLLASLFVIIGYFNSDNVFYNKLLKSQKLTKPVQVFNWTIKNYVNPNSQYVNSYASPRYLITKQHWLYCDEAATVMATLDHLLGYKTRMVDLYGFDNISHHTILEVLENDKWITYDFTNKIYNKPIKASSIAYFKLKEARIKKYPKLYNAIINSNSFIKGIALNLRGIKE